MTLRERAAKALDVSLSDAMAMRGIHTEHYRWALAGWLDGARKLKSSTVRIMCSYLVHGK